MDEINSVEAFQKASTDLTTKKTKDLEAVQNIPCGEKSVRKAQKYTACLGNHVDDLVIKDCSPPGSSVHGISQARILEWVAISFSRGFS